MGSAKRGLGGVIHWPRCVRKQQNHRHSARETYGDRDTVVVEDKGGVDAGHFVLLSHCGKLVVLHR